MHADRRPQLREFLEANPDIAYIRKRGLYQVLSTLPVLWNLADWQVSSIIGLSVLLVRREDGREG